MKQHMNNVEKLWKPKVEQSNANKAYTNLDVHNCWSFTMMSNTMTLSHDLELDATHNLKPIHDVGIVSQAQPLR